MGIFSRLADIVNSNLNSLLDQAEDPKKLIRLIVQEMEETLVEVRTSSVRIIADKKEASRRLERLQLECHEWESKAKLALSKDREDLARAAIAERSEVHSEAVAVEAEIVAISEHLSKLETEVSQLQSKLDDARSKQKTMLIREKTVKSRYKVKNQLADGKLNKAYEKFEAFERRLDEYEGHVESMDVGRKDLASEIDQLAADDKINAELDRLKKEIESSNT